MMNMVAQGDDGQMDFMFDKPGGDFSEEMSVTPDQAFESAQRYLDAYLAGTQADDHATAFYGYYTLHILRDGETIGMLSVNGYTRQVFIHHWHGTFLEMGLD